MSPFHALDEREVGFERHLQHVVAAVELAVSLPSAINVPTPVGVKKPAMPAPPARIRSEKVPCGTSSTSISFCQELPLELLVLADVGRDHLAHLPRLEQQPDAEAVDAGVVAR